MGFHSYAVLQNMLLSIPYCGQHLLQPEDEMKPTLLDDSGFSLCTFWKSRFNFFSKAFSSAP